MPGSATASVLRVERFTHPLLAPLIYDQPWLSATFTFWTLLFELTAPILLWLPGLRWLVTVQSVLFLGGTTDSSLLSRRLAGDDLFAAWLSLAGRTHSPVAQPLDPRVGGFGGV